MSNDEAGFLFPARPELFSIIRNGQRQEYISSVGGRASLEREPQCELHDPRVHCRERNDAEGCREDVRVRDAELRGIEGIEELRAEFDAGAFMRMAERRPFDERDVEVPLVRAEHDTYAAVAESGGEAVIANHRPAGRAGACELAKEASCS